MHIAPSTVEAPNGYRLLPISDGARFTAGYLTNRCPVALLTACVLFLNLCPVPLSCLSLYTRVMNLLKSDICSLTRASKRESKSAPVRSFGKCDRGARTDTVTKS